MEKSLGLGDIIKNARKNLGFSQKELANWCGVHVTSLGKFERGKSKPSLASLKKLCESLELNFKELVEKYYDLSDNDIGNIIKSERIKMGLSQNDFATKCEIDTDSLSRFERGKTEPSLESLQKICENSDLDFKELVKKYYDLSDNDIGNIIKIERIKAGLSQRELANRCGISRQRLSQIENESHNLSSKNLKKFSDILNLDFEQLNAKFYETSAAAADDDDELGNIIKCARLKLALSQTELSQLSGVSMYEIWTIENCLRKPNLLAVKKLCEVLKVNFEEILKKFIDVSDNNKIGNMIKVARINLDMSQTKLSQVSGVSISTICQVEKGKSSSKPAITKLATVLKINLDEQTCLTNVRTPK